MKGKNEFTQNEINEIVDLIRQRCSAVSGEQKNIRNYCCPIKIGFD